MHSISPLISGLLFILASVVLSDQRVGQGITKTVPSQQWAGAVVDGADIQVIAANVTIPTILPAGDPASSPESGASIWVGLGDDTYQNGCGSQGNLFKVGVKMTLNESGSFYTAWYEWYPYSAHSLNVTISPGDVVRIGVGIIPDRSLGVFLVINFNNNQFSEMEVEPPVLPCTTRAGWIVEDYGDGNGGLIPFANFTPVDFTDTFAVDSARETHSPRDANSYQMFKGTGAHILAYLSSADMDALTIKRGSG